MIQVTTPLLKFMAEFVLNKAQRLTFDSSSPNGILLFREVSKLIVAYGSRILSLPNASEIYAFKYKGIWISLTIISRGKIMDLLINCFVVLFTVVLKSNLAWFLVM
jgi:exportin-7